MKILIGGAGGAPSEGVIKSLLSCEKGDEIIGMGSEPTDLALSAAKRKYFVPYATEQNYCDSLMKILIKEKPDLVHFQNDIEIFAVSKIRKLIEDIGVKLFMPKHEVIDTCVHKYKTYLKLVGAGIRVPRNLPIDNLADLENAFSKLSDAEGRIWLRSSSIGAGGKGALPTNDFQFAKGWLDFHKGWGDFVAAEILTTNSVTWLSIWNEGKLIVAQSRLRKGWTHGNRTVSGVTGVTKIGQTCSSQLIDDIAMATIKAVDSNPHGIYGVDMSYDKEGMPNPTEINISRFFTTVLFFTQAGLNMPKIFKDLVLYNEFPNLETIFNPLPNNLLWLRGMDTLPRLITENDLINEIIFPA
jgi:carbamoyl-phosphate synthase large subunit